MHDIKLTPKKREALNQLEIKEIEDILSFYPFRYEERQLKNWQDWSVEENIIINGHITSKPRYFRYKANAAMISFQLEAQDNIFNVTCFNQPWIVKYDLSKEVTVIGKYEGYSKIVASSVNQAPIETQIGILPVYSLKNRLKPKDFSSIVRKALESNRDMENFLPDDIITEKNLMQRYDAFEQIHFPENKEKLFEAINTLKWEEFIRFSLSLIRKHDINHQQNHKYAKSFDIAAVERFITGIPFTLTDDQQSACNEIIEDLKAGKQMYRLLQGDVGCGKTIVSFVGIYCSYLSGNQSALMAPTELLASQHYNNFIKTFEKTGIKCALLVSDITAAQRNEIYEGIRTGEIDVVIGTHALIQNSVEFASLGLVVTDEQHRFGVKQREMLQSKSDHCDILLMSATPIPRTLASTIYADMDVTTISQMPNSRKKVTTKLIRRNGFYDIKDEIHELLKQGNQMYVVCAAIDNDSQIPVRNVNDVYKSLSEYYTEFRIALIHSKLDEEEKKRIEDDFYNHRIDILVSTTVVEVGIDVRNANIMIIYDANRFGMSQLHQLRGRVGRGEKEGFCYLLTSSTDPLALKRLEIIENNNDGFKISYYDLQLRGPGDLLGVRQSGLPSFVLGNLINDSSIIEESKKYARMILDDIDNPMYANIRSYLEKLN